MIRRPRHAFFALSFLWSSLASASVFPKNDLHKNDDLKRKTAVDKDTFHAILKKVERTYAPIVKNLGGELQIKGQWDRSEVNGQANRAGKIWEVKMNGGLARLEKMTPEIFTFMTCHELGHHVAGFPFYPDVAWPSAESEADYYATRVCLKKLWQNETAENASQYEAALPIVKKRCSESFAEVEDRNLCARTAMAGDRYAKFYADIRGFYPPEIETPEPFVVYATFFTHAKAQAKLDIYFAGATCNAPWKDNIIPGYKHPDGHNGAGAEREAAKYSCHEASGYAAGLRPKSYFLPKVELEAIQLGSMTVNPSASGIVGPGESAKVRVTIGNKAKETTKAVTATLKSLTPGVNVTHPIAVIGDVEPSKVSISTPFGIQFDRSFECGSAFELDVFVRTANAGTANFRKTFLSGNMNQVFSYKNENEFQIPPYGKVRSQIVSDFEGETRRARVKALIKHHYGRDIKLFLISPDGKRRFLTSPAPTEDDMIQIDEEVDIPVSSAKGTWELEVVDDLDIHTEGFVFWWELSLIKAKCH